MSGENFRKMIECIFKVTAVATSSPHFPHPFHAIYVCVCGGVWVKSWVSVLSNSATHFPPTQRNGKLCSRDLKVGVLENLRLHAKLHSCFVYFSFSVHFTLKKNWIFKRDKFLIFLDTNHVCYRKRYCKSKAPQKKYM